MNCLCCNKPLNESASAYERDVQWHKKCMKHFFGTSALPALDISEDTLKCIAIEATNKGCTVPGVQKKLSLHLTEGKEPRLTLVNYPAGYILKPQTEEYEHLPEAEFLVMHLAKSTGIKTVPFALIKMDGSFAYITKRIDRVTQKSGVKMLAMEDFCQLEERLTQDKYKSSYERCAKIITRYSVRSGFDVSELFVRLVFSFVTGNSDMHLKNFSLIETAEKSCEYVLAAAYDMLPVNAILPEDSEQFALTMNGKKSAIRKKDFLAFAETIALQKTIAEKILKDIAARKEAYLAMCAESYLPEKMKRILKGIIEERIAILEA